MLRSLVILSVFAIPLLSAQAADGGNAFAALRTAQKVAPSGALVQMTGTRGEPRPSEWTILFSDPQARGGVREVVVSGDVVVSQRTPLRGFSGVSSLPPVKLTQLNTDSDAAFKIADQQARNQSIGFNWIDYSLQSENVSGAPVWTLKLFDHMGAPVGTLKVSAQDGSLIQPLEGTPVVRHSSGDENSDGPTRRLGGVLGTATGIVERTANNVKNVTLRTVGTVQEVLTGERTIGPKDDDGNNQ